MNLSKRGFVKLVSLGTAGFFIGTSLPVSARFRSHKEKTLEDERPRIRVIGVGVGTVRENGLRGAVQEAIQSPLLGRYFP